MPTRPDYNALPAKARNSTPAALALLDCTFGVVPDKHWRANAQDAARLFYSSMVQILQFDMRPTREALRGIASSALEYYFRTLEESTHEVFSLLARKPERDETGAYLPCPIGQLYAGHDRYERVHAIAAAFAYQELTRLAYYRAVEISPDSAERPTYAIQILCDCITRGYLAQALGLDLDRVPAKGLRGFEGYASVRGPAAAGPAHRNYPDAIAALSSFLEVPVHIETGFTSGLEQMRAKSILKAICDLFGEGELTLDFVREKGAAAITDSYATRRMGRGRKPNKLKSPLVLATGLALALQRPAVRDLVLRVEAVMRAANARHAEPIVYTQLEAARVTVGPSPFMKYHFTDILRTRARAAYPVGDAPLTVTEALAEAARLPTIFPDPPAPPAPEPAKRTRVIRLPSEPEEHADA